MMPAMSTRWLPLLLLASCATPEWQVETALASGEKLGGCAAGDVLAERPGPELVAVSVSGKVYVVYRGADGWTAETAFDGPGELIQVAVGDVYSERPGAEIAAVGMARGPEDAAGPGAAWLLSRADGSWLAERLYEDPKLLHGVCIHRGRVYVSGFSQQVVELQRGEERFDARVVQHLSGAGKAMAATDDGLVTACNDGSLALVRPEDNGSEGRVLDRREAGRARLDADGRQVLVADDDGTLSLVRMEGQREPVHDQPETLRGAALAELDPGVPGLEAACAGYGSRITVLVHRRGEWLAAVVHQEPDSIHHLIDADLDGDGLAELIAAGYAGNLVVVRRR